MVEKAEGSDVPISLIEEVVSKTKIIAHILRHSVDLEWVYDGSDLYWVQVRAITTLNHRNVYSNYIPREMLPGMIKPLIFSVNIPLVNSIWINWMSEITGDLGLKPEDLAKSFYYRVYFNMGALVDIFEGLGFPRDSVEMIMGSLPRGAVKHSFKPSAKTFSRLPWLSYFTLDKWTFGPKMRRALTKLAKRVKATPYLDLDQWSESDLLAAIDRHYKLMQETAYYNVMGPLLMGMYNNILKTQLTKRDVDFVNFDLTQGMDEILKYGPAPHLRRLNAEFRVLQPEVQKKIREVSYADFQKMNEAGDFHNDFQSTDFHYDSYYGRSDISYDNPDNVLFKVTGITKSGDNVTFTWTASKDLAGATVAVNPCNDNLSKGPTFRELGAYLAYAKGDDWVNDNVNSVTSSAPLGQPGQPASSKNLFTSLKTTCDNTNVATTTGLVVASGAKSYASKAALAFVAKPVNRGTFTIGATPTGRGGIDLLLERDKFNGTHGATLRREADVD